MFYVQASWSVGLLATSIALLLYLFFKCNVQIKPTITYENNKIMPSFKFCWEIGVGAAKKTKIFLYDYSLSIASSHWHLIIKSNMAKCNVMLKQFTNPEKAGSVTPLAFTETVLQGPCKILHFLSLRILHLLLLLIHSYCNRGESGV